MNILILGSGLLGVTTAYELGKRGISVTVIDRQPESGRECSHANGGQLSYTHAEPWASPAILPKLPKWVFDPSSPLVLHPRADWQMARWGLKFLANCTTGRANANCATILNLGLYSRKRMDVIRRETGFEFDYNGKGILHIYKAVEDLDAARRQNEFQEKFGGAKKEISAEECLAMEPALKLSPRPIVGGLHAYMDECGDSYPFCTALAKIAAERHGVKFEYGVNIKSLQLKNGRIASVSTDKGELTADGYVMALGSYSPVFLRQVGIDVPIYPMKGYSITLYANKYTPESSLTDGTHKIVYTRLGERLRIAGTAELNGYNDSINERRIAAIVKAANGLFPGIIAEDQPIEKWACLRPSTPDGPPILGRTPCPNLFLNTGHGTLGWTQAAGSASIVADIIEGKKPEILMQGLGYER